MISFDGAYKAAIDTIADLKFARKPDAPIVIVRDLQGRLRICVKADAPKKRREFDAERDELRAFEQKWTTALGRFAPASGSTFLFETDFFDAASVWESPDRHRIRDGGGRELWFIDRAVGGQDWLRAALPSGRATRLAFHGIKGGVGRSTAAAFIAHELAAVGKSVLVVDLDLESPGLSSTLLATERLPEFGVVDFFVEDAVGIGDPKDFVRQMLATSHIADGLPGGIQLLSAYGQQREDYIGKLSRTYVPVARDGQLLSFAERLNHLIGVAESVARADVVLLDCRSGVDDIAAATLARLGAELLLFGTSSAQTWSGYELLFRHLSKRDDLDRFRKQLSVIAALVPEDSPMPYVQAVKERAYDLFSEWMYDEGKNDPSAFSYDVDSEDAPHFPVAVGYYRGLVDFDPIARPEQIREERLRVSFRQLVDLVSRLTASET